MKTPVRSINDDPLATRCMLFMVDESDVLHMMRLAGDLRHIVEEGGECSLSVPEIQGLPDGAQIRSVHYDYVTRAFAFRIHHASFEEVPRGRMISSGMLGLETCRFQVSFRKGDAQITLESVGENVPAKEPHA